jgi:hypothetical protein
LLLAHQLTGVIVVLADTEVERALVVVAHPDDVDFWAGGTVTPNCQSWTGWAAIPGDSLGRYDVTAVQGNLSAKGAITVLPADEPSLMILDSPGGVERLTVHPGATIGILLVGFDPHQDIGLLFYYTPSFQAGGGENSVKGLRFRGSTTVTTNGEGTTIFRLKTSPTDLRGCYAVNTWPPLVALQRHLNPPYPPLSVVC